MPTEQANSYNCISPFVPITQSMLGISVQNKGIPKIPENEV